MENITNLKVGETAKIVKVDCESKIKFRLLELGFVANEIVEVLAISSLKKTYLIKVQDCVIAIRSSILKEVIICKQ